MFFWKCLLNPDVKAFPNHIPVHSSPGTRGADDRRTFTRLNTINISLVWSWNQDEKGYTVLAFGTQLRCRPNPESQDPITGKKIPADELPMHRSLAFDSFFFFRRRA